MKDSILKNIKKGIFSDFKEEKSKPKKNKISFDKEIKFLNWDDRNQVSKVILLQKEVTIVTPQKDLATSSDSHHVVYITIDNHNAWIEVDFGCLTMSIT
jgi:hypothetical protein